MSDASIETEAPDDDAVAAEWEAKAAEGGDEESEPEADQNAPAGASCRVLNQD